MHEISPTSSTDSPLRVGLALGSGAARGWAHIGVLRALRAEGIEPDIIAGCSIGAFIGAAVATGNFDKLGQWVEKLTWQSVVSFLDVSFRGGLIKGDKIIQHFEREFVDIDFAALKMPFACVATELQTGREVWLREGSVARAVRASIALPGLFAPVIERGRLLVDGGLVNPVPVSLCRAMGADIVVAVDLGSDTVGRARRRLRREIKDVAEEEAEKSWADRLLERFGLDNGHRQAPEQMLPSMLDVLATSINIMQVRIARSRMAGDPADVSIYPRVGQVGPMDYHRAAEAIAEGEAAVERVMPAIRYALGREVEEGHHDA
ncbi:patatin-like phospholipase RssA [Nitrogeniibacter mangrovi]|uniref:Patatin-like phospholipase RssA n=1 Tax=Nitrogeniibacter mangrovi TaxID=2016596 RepID=A0A6C1B344_9RHOO|nr:patatin-like phospholipase RssA [Nitrogeniibacter mangrovi]QID18071.1 patatin-like phospholipase RssA [Nitrogeniibacter mangrovi]